MLCLLLYKCMLAVQDIVSHALLALWWYNWDMYFLGISVPYCNTLFFSKTDIYDRYLNQVVYIFTQALYFQSSVLLFLLHYISGTKLTMRGRRGGICRTTSASKLNIITSHHIVNTCLKAVFGFLCEVALGCCRMYLDVTSRVGYRRRYF